MVEIKIGAQCQVIGKLISRLTLPKDTLILFIARGNEQIVPDGSFTFKENDTLFIITRKETLHKVEKLFNADG